LLLLHRRTLREGGCPSYVFFSLEALRESEGRALFAAPSVVGYNNSHNKCFNFETSRKEKEEEKEMGGRKKRGKKKRTRPDLPGAQPPEKEKNPPAPAPVEEEGRREGRWCVPTCDTSPARWRAWWPALRRTAWRSAKAWWPSAV
jgi:hypothetical protein